MARKPRIVVEGGMYHVYNRIASGEAVFADPNEAVELVEIIRKVKERDGWTVFAWAVMSNHFHLVVRTSAIPLSRGMHGIQNGFSRGFNRRHRRTGSLWQSRYRTRYVGEQGYLDRLVLYVHLNPVEAGVVKEPADYVFAGHREVKKRIRDPLVDVDAMLLCFGTTEKAARRSYLAAIRAGKDADAEGLSQDWHPFANDPEIKMDPKVVHVDAVGRTTGLERPRLEAEQFVGMACEIGGLDQERLASRARDRETAEARQRSAPSVGDRAAGTSHV